MSALAPPLPLALIAAVARNGVIGAGNSLPWHLPGDLRHFKALTVGRPVLMGRRTFESIGRPLPGRPVVVVSRRGDFAPEGVTVARSPNEALERGEAIGRAIGAAAVMLAGGGELYAALIGRADRLHITHVDAAPEGDTLFPPIDPAIWVEIHRDPPVTEATASPSYHIVTYGRRSEAPSATP